MPAESRLRVYADTSAIGGCLDAEFELASRRLFARFESGEYLLVLSDVTLAELERAPTAVKDLIRRLPAGSKEQVPLTPQAERLAEFYLEEGVVPKRMWSDAQHIAIATVNGVDVLVSWNFKHVVNLQRIRGYNHVNAKLGYGMLEIRTPQEVISDDQ